jgi:hypothetical protein
MGSPREDAIEGLYAVFAGCALPAHTAGCDHCVDEADLAGLRTTPLRKLTHDDLFLVASNVGLTWGGADEVRYLLPRLLELAEPSWIDWEIVLARLRYCGWSDWPAEQQAAVRAFLDALWREAIEGALHPFRFDEILCGIGQAEDDLSPYLARWLESGSAAAAVQLAGFVLGNAEALEHGRLGNAFWEERSSARQLIEWLFSPPPLLALDGAAARFRELPSGAALRDGYEMLCVLHGMRR